MKKNTFQQTVCNVAEHTLLNTYISEQTRADDKETVFQTVSTNGPEKQTYLRV